MNGFVLLETFRRTCCIFACTLATVMFAVVYLFDVALHCL